MEHLKQETVSGAQLNMDALYQICPQCFTESKDPKTGEVRHSVDFDKLRLSLGDNVAEGEEPVFMIPEYATMANREVISSGIEDDMIYTLTKITLQDGTELNVLYVNEPDTLFCRAISVENGNQTTLYTNFVYDADLE